jgi:hypothetical protein
MCTERDDFGIAEVLRAADAVTCKCGDAGCDLPPPSIEAVVRWQADPDDE